MFATVQKLDNGTAEVAWTSQSGCGSCSRCGSTRRTARIEVTDGSLKPGSLVELSVSRKQVALSLSLAFLLPAMLAIAAVAVTSQLGGNDTLSALAALATVALGWVVMAVIVRKNPNLFQLQISRGEHHA